MNKMYYIKMGAMLLLLNIMNACNPTNDHSHEPGIPATGELEVDVHEEDNVVHLNRTQIDNVGIKWGAFETKELSSTLKVTGKLELPPQNQAKVGSLSGGRLKGIKIRPGQYVRKGQLLATLENEEFITLQQEYFESSNQIFFLQKELKRQELLAEQKISASKSLEQVQASLESAKIRKEGLDKRIALCGIQANTLESIQRFLPVIAPISGHIREIHVRMGEYVNPDSDLFEIINNDHVHIDFFVYESDIHLIKKEQEIQFFLQSKPDVVLSARVFAIGKVLEQEERAVMVHAEVDNQEGNLIPGMFVEGRIILDDTEKEFCVPEDAIATDNGLFYIFEKLEEEEGEIHFRKTQVIKGTSDFGYTEIKMMDEINKEASVVKKGAFFLMAQSKKDQSGEMHHH